jgi:hypothetical protein
LYAQYMRASSRDKQRTLPPTPTPTAMATTGVDDEEEVRGGTTAPLLDEADSDGEEG